ncbi:unnamed protein product, partial [Oikopleura dioica]
DNDICAKIVQKLEMTILDNRLFSSFEKHEYNFHNLFSIKMNVSPLAQDCELFSSGRFDHTESDASELDEILIRNGLTVAENRQQYATKKWVKNDDGYAFVDGQSLRPFEIEMDEYEFRAPIIHGLAKQQRVLPTGSRVTFEVTLGQQGNCLMEISEEVKCKIPKSLAEQISWPIGGDLRTTKKSKEHAEVGDCDCEDSKFTSGHYLEVHETAVIGGDPRHSDPSDCYDKTVADGKYTKWRAHSVDYNAFDYENIEDDTSHVTFYKKHKLNPTDLMAPLEYSLESVFCKASKKQAPLSTGNKGEAMIPFYYPKLKRAILSPGLAMYLEPVSTGPLPKMIIITGMSHSRYESSDFQKTSTKTQLYAEGFKIKSFTVYIDNIPALRSPWKSAHEHYLNFMKHNGRWTNKAVALGQDFFHFRDQNWMVPLFFDDSIGNTGHIQIQIEFEEPLSDHWDLLSFVVPVNELLLDGNRQEAVVMHKNANGQKRKRGGLDDYSCPTKDAPNSTMAKKKK